jgi:hypothetical protein
VGIVELQAKLMGEIQTGNQSVTVNLQAISPQQAVQYANDILEFFGADMALQPERAMPLIEGEVDTSAGEVSDGNSTEEHGRSITARARSCPTAVACRSTGR